MGQSSAAGAHVSAVAPVNAAAQHWSPAGQQIDGSAASGEGWHATRASGQAAAHERSSTQIDSGATQSSQLKGGEAPPPPPRPPPPVLFPAPVPELELALSSSMGLMLAEQLASVTLSDARQATSVVPLL